MIPFIDPYLNRVTMYRLMLYYLLFLALVAAILSFFSLLPFKPQDIILSAVILTSFSFLTNKMLAWMFHAVTNTESSLITGLILALIVDPSVTASNFIFLLLVSVLAMSSKYLISIKDRHIFNPAAFATLAAALTVGQGASWWVNNLMMAPFIITFGLLILRKMRRFQMVAIFLLSYFLLVGVVERSELQLLGHLFIFTNSLINSPILFFSFVMLVEPLTSPTKRVFQLYYGTIVAVSYIVFQAKFAGFPPIPELALLTGNFFSYLLAPQIRMVLRLRRKQKIAKDTFSFLFEKEANFKFTPGQFLEYTLPHKGPDSRGNRRYFTISSSPTEKFVMLTAKIYQKPSSFKRALLAMKEEEEIIASYLAGEFILPRDSQKECVFIAGGIGITPFRSMVKYLLDKKISRPIILLHSNKVKDEIVFKDLFSSARKAFGLKTVYTLTDKTTPNWIGGKGYINEKMIKKEVPDYRNKLFYISGPQKMVQDMEKMLKNLRVSKNNIKVDYFPGYM